MTPDPVNVYGQRTSGLKGPDRQRPGTIKGLARPRPQAGGADAAGLLRRQWP